MKVKNLVDRLGELATLIEREPFRELIGVRFTNTTEQGGRPNIDVVLMIKLLFLQSMYGLSNPELERQANDKISFLRFLGFPEKFLIKRRSGISGNGSTSLDQFRSHEK